MRARPGAALALVAALVSPGCVALRWSHAQTFEPVGEEGRAALEVGESGLADALCHLGAPIFVWEQSSETIAIAYGWSNDRNTGATVSAPVARFVSASIRYDDLVARLYGLVLVFDRDLVLQVVREGYLRDIAPELREGGPERARPAYDDAWFRAAIESGQD